MSTVPVPDDVSVLVDARGHRCPVPTLRLRRALDRLGGGEVAAVLADDPLARIDIPHFASSNGHTLMEITNLGGHIRALVRKGHPKIK